jgi:hypothetical protein
VTQPGGRPMHAWHMVPFFVSELACCPGIVPNVNRLAGALRSAGGTVAWVLPGAGEPSATADEFYGPEIAELYRRSGGEGPLEQRLWHELAVDNRDLLVEKTAASRSLSRRRRRATRSAPARPGRPCRRAVPAPAAAGPR